MKMDVDFALHKADMVAGAGEHALTTLAREVRRLRGERGDSKCAHGKTGPCNDCVICPNCVHQFRAIPVNVQHLLLSLGVDPPDKSLAVGRDPHADASPSSASRSDLSAFEAGWRMAAEWTNRDDLLSDIGSPAYNEDRERFLNGDCAASRVPGQAEHGTAGIAQTGYASSARREPEPGGSECGDGRHDVARQRGSSASSARPETPSDAGNSRSLSGSSAPLLTATGKELAKRLIEAERGPFQLAEERYLSIARVAVSNLMRVEAAGQPVVPRSTSEGSEWRPTVIAWGVISDDSVVMVRFDTEAAAEDYAQRKGREVHRLISPADYARICGTPLLPPETNLPAVQTRTHATQDEAAGANRRSEGRPEAGAAEPQEKP